MRLRSTDISSRTIGDETIILNLPNSTYFSVTGIGTRLVELLAADTTLPALVTAITEEYEVDAATAQRDIEKFLGRLRDARLLV